jgi:plasmid stabilization system protein ParE
VSENAYSEKFRQDALAEFEAVVDHYSQISPELGLEFFRAVTKELDELLMFPESAQVYHPSGVRRRNLRRFPYAIFYLLEGAFLVVIAIAHQRRDVYWFERLRER